MPRIVRFIVLTLVVSALVAAPTSAVPTSSPAKTPAPVAGLIASAREWLAWLKTAAPSKPPRLDFKSPTDTSHLDPNGGH